MKPLTIEIPESLQHKLIEIANQSNVTVESFILGVLDRAAEVPNHSIGTPLKTLIDIQNILTELKPELTDKYHVSQLGIFGSYARGDYNSASDIDIIVEYSQKPSLFGLIELQDYLSDRLQMKVDLVTKDGLKPQIKEKILAEVIYL
ncbi:MAG: nucleotidyltransferase family protein [Pseudanabaena sp.]|jgi:predicted nucleotidyltransferase|nr:nucleotidyltransferase family protein [Pseudanabaena sp. M090S1SP2A07QC]MCA6507392.1 nucleotidyltransferase family protein [Pseudanabaena sp. M172S2SP2A07QC]MCA6520365.1 nucleotidyltransferase family protein [Pseudanabaena sp. M051S1SP2A07QC]MCA6525363.1 nucleotidyltransferase family protein [Pseudanabaena sp. M179S2SP2A07QC]MCA6528755.1 nucleotidyltransferase family protein [Pseudanabaena sp. M125S2SP2A07QC]MCA6536328.1 nucleotidyltransferase family protein [Pseudanabaena sp. M176S2SP2A07Q